MTITLAHNEEEFLGIISPDAKEITKKFNELKLITQWRVG